MRFRFSQNQISYLAANNTFRAQCLPLLTLKLLMLSLCLNAQVEMVASDECLPYSLIQKANETPLRPGTLCSGRFVFMGCIPMAHVPAGFLPEDNIREEVLWSLRRESVENVGREHEWMESELESEKFCLNYAHEGEWAGIDLIEQVDEGEPPANHFVNDDQPKGLSEFFMHLDVKKRSSSDSTTHAICAKGKIPRDASLQKERNALMMFGAEDSTFEEAYISTANNGEFEHCTLYVVDEWGVTHPSSTPMRFFATLTWPKGTISAYHEGEEMESLTEGGCAQRSPMGFASILLMGFALVRRHKHRALRHHFRRSWEYRSARRKFSFSC